MYHPTARVLTVLEILQARSSARGADLATRLEVDIRTIRRYITILQEMGIPVESRSGRSGGYRLRPGFRLPPLMLANDEALAVTLGLLLARRFGLTGAAPATEGALAKIERVLPDALRIQVRALAESLVLDPPNPPSPDTLRPPLPVPATLLALATAAAEERRTTLTYRNWEGIATTRPFDPYAVVYPANAAWYTVGYCHLRGGVRVFRLDRVVTVEPEGDTVYTPSLTLTTSPMCSAHSRYSPHAGRRRSSCTPRSRRPGSGSHRSSRSCRKRMVRWYCAAPRPTSTGWRVYLLACRSPSACAHRRSCAVLLRRYTRGSDEQSRPPHRPLYLPRNRRGNVLPLSWPHSYHGRGALDSEDRER